MNPRLIATAVASAAAGGLVGYLVAQKKLSAEFEARLERETNAVRRLYGGVRKEFVESPEEVAEPTEAELEAVANTLKEYQGEREHVSYEKIRQTTAQKIEVEQKPERNNVFQERDERGEIYVISGDEFEENEPNYMQVTLTYYAGDGVVTDVQEMIIEDIDDILGEDWVEQFGAHNDDPNVVHVRNEKMDNDFEVVRNPSTYRESVLGEEPQLPPLPSGRERPVRPRDRISSDG